jgi:hypothetical protein
MQLKSQYFAVGKVVVEGAGGREKKRLLAQPSQFPSPRTELRQPTATTFRIIEIFLQALQSSFKFIFGFY